MTDPGRGSGMQSGQNFDSGRGSGMQSGQSFHPDRGSGMQSGQSFHPDRGSSGQCAQRFNIGCGSGMQPEQSFHPDRGSGMQSGQGFDPGRTSGKQSGQSFHPDRGSSGQYAQSFNIGCGSGMQPGQSFHPDRGSSEQYAQSVNVGHNSGMQSGQGFNPDCGSSGQYAQGYNQFPGSSMQSGQSFDPDASEFVPTLASGPGSSAAFAAHKPTMQPFPLYSSTTAQPMKSAETPSKATWDASVDRSHSQQPEQSLLSPSQPHNVSTPGSTGLSNAFSRLGMMDSTIKYVRGADGRVSGARVSPGLASLRYTQTEQYHASDQGYSPTSQPGKNMKSHTDPLPQYPFGSSPHTAVISSSEGSGFTQNYNIPGWASSGTPRSGAQAQALAGTGQQPSDGQQSDGNSSIVISDHYAQPHPEMAGMKGEVWVERPHIYSMRRALKDHNVEWVESFGGAVAMLTALNPEQFQLQYGTRIINIKTEFPRNLIKSVVAGKYSVIQKVAQRISKVWESRSIEGEKILFLFSVNGSKRYSGIAELSGDWIGNDSMEDWENSPESEPCLGTFPVTWIFAKDVSYHQFQGIRQPNGHPVGNMWNGMNFPAETGRQVLEAYVCSPSFSSILGQPRANFESAIRQHGNMRDRGRDGLRSAPPYSLDWRYVNGPPIDGDAEDEPTPVASRPAAMLARSNDPSPGYSAPVAASIPVQPRQIYSFVLNDQGQFTLVQTGEQHYTANSSYSRTDEDKGNHGVHDRRIPTKEVDRTAQGGSHRALHCNRSLIDMHRQDVPLTTMHQANANPSNAMLHPAVSMGAGPVQQARAMPPHPEMTSGLHYPTIAGRTAVYGSVRIMPRPSDETPTHRPAPHGNRYVAAPNTSNPFTGHIPPPQPPQNLLMANYHTLVAQQYNLQFQLQETSLGDQNARLVSNKLAHVLDEKRKVRSQLGALGFTNLETLPPPRRASSSSGDHVSSAGGCVISPVRAEDGRRLRSASKLVSPIRGTEIGNFDRAPGGSARQKDPSKGHATASTGTWEVQLRSINNLLKSPENTPVSVHPALETSTSFSENSGGRQAFSFQSPNENDGTPNAQGGRNAFSPPTPRGNVNTQNAAFGSKSFGAYGTGGVRLN